MSSVLSGLVLLVFLAMFGLSTALSVSFLKRDFETKAGIEFRLSGSESRQPLERGYAFVRQYWEDSSGRTYARKGNFHLADGAGRVEFDLEEGTYEVSFDSDDGRYVRTGPYFLVVARNGEWQVQGAEGFARAYEVRLVHSGQFQ